MKGKLPRLETLLEGTGFAYFSVDREWRFTYLNRLAEYFEKRKKEELVGKKMWEVFPRILETEFFKKYQEAMATGTATEFEMFDDNFWFEIRVYPSDDGLSVFYRDITERKQLEERKDEFIRLASHELKTPITALRLYAELVQESLKDHKLGQHVDKIVQQADKLNELVTELLDLSRIQVGKLSFKLKTFDFAELVDDSIVILQKIIPSHTIKYHKLTQKALVRGDKIRLTQVITNLINNAVKYSPGEEEIIVTLKRKPGRVVLSVTDRGIGIPFAFRKKVFNRFYQVPHNNSDTFPGMGIGLYISKTITDKHGGSLSVLSSEAPPEHGSTFILELPLHHQTSHGKTT